MNTINFVSVSRSLKCTQICHSVVLVEAIEYDRFGWENGDEFNPAFLVYMGFNSKENAEEMKKSLLRFWRADEVVIRRSKRFLNYEWELKAYGLQRETDSYAYGLDYLVQTEQLAEECDRLYEQQYQEAQEKADLMAGKDIA